ncbi:hypothetical protein [Streptomyces sp. 3213.3]|uniref:hypothetical protein n=1 Tax=Streptomyces sp. 3213.3 TaxID=1855348 RepID=UPI000A906CFA|nr:hypothetical protein [Streptomyces sp. 3213.3]
MIGTGVFALPSALAPHGPVSKTLVDAHDPALAAPTKFAGPVYDHQHVLPLAELHGWHVAPDGDRWRRVVPSPEPRRIVEQDSITHLLENRAVVICGGGGGAPVTDDGTGLLQGSRPSSTRTSPQPCSRSPCTPTGCWYSPTYPP